MLGSRDQIVGRVVAESGGTKKKSNEPRKKWFGVNREPKVVWFLPAMQLLEHAPVTHVMHGRAGGERPGATGPGFGFGLRGHAEEVSLLAPDRETCQQWVAAIRLVQQAHAARNRAAGSVQAVNST